MTWITYVGSTDVIRNAHKTLVREPEERKPFGRPRRTWEDNIKIEQCEYVNWVQVIQNRGFCERGDEAQGPTNAGYYCND
jgi:hypothetical protein